MINDEQKSRRHTYIGGSDVPIIMGKSKFKTPWELLLEKAQIRTVDFGGNIYSHVGSVLEPKIQEVMNIKNVDEIDYLITYENVPFECHIDGIDKNEDLFYEIKVANQTLVECYESYEWQIRTYMYATGIKSAQLVLLNRNNCSGGYLKKCINYVLNYYNVDYLHDFNKIENCEDVIRDINVGLENLKFTRNDLLTKNIEFDEDKQNLMLKKVSTFWDYKTKLEQEPLLADDLEFRQSFLKEF